MKIDHEQLFENAKNSAQQWLDSFTIDGNPDVKEVQKCLDSRTFEGEPVTALVARSPKESVEIMVAWAEQQIKESGKKFSKQKKKEYIQSMFSEAHNCIWDYYLMSFYESACGQLPDKDFPGSEFVYQSLLPAFKAGLGYLINLGPLVVGVCLPEAYRDEQMRIHKENGPAITWGDDKQYWWHGVKVQEDWIMNKDSVDPSLCLTHPNIEERRALCEIIGWDRVIDILNPEILDTDIDPQIGVLLQVNIPDSGTQKFLRVKEGSTGRQFCIGVPNEMQTALDAQAEINQIPRDLFRMGYIRS